MTRETEQMVPLPGESHEASPLRGGKAESGRARDVRRLVERGARARWWRRRGSKVRGFWYVDAQGARITEAAAVERIQALRIPPAWREVRISPSPRGRLQAVGVDTSGRVQYLYHAEFAARQQRKKYAKIERFGALLPKLRQVTNADIAREGFPRERVLAVVVRLINDLYFRLGSEKSVQRYRTFGVTTLRNYHLRTLPGGTLLFQFTGKHHILQRRLYVDPELADLVEQIKGLGGRRLFNYLDAQSRPHPVTAQEVNRYIQEAVGREFSAKDFRTWGGTLLAALALAEMGPPANEKQAQKNMVQAARRVAERLGNTPTVCRACYIHPVVFARYLEGKTLADYRPRHRRRILHHQPDYDLEELELLKLFQGEETESQAA